ncbi:hypothetical protein EDM59_21075 [Brevibacillus nitrificans]|uniref:Uncharacterized protein n=1 Tax=Brevibacillus nitrificans TaxID=651560 RepID=A0A3M8D202_9BACL|nr:E2/UBC family protein [Brevibacillus nitrificans]RNB82106.1 hypothetical protein EDM59_21075 [Brevibacillus nitrificans]
MDILTLIQDEIKEYDQNILLSMTPIPSDNRFNYRRCKNVMEIMVPINGKPTVLAVGFPEFFPKELPKFFDRSNQFNRIPHKEPDGFLCFSNTESMLIDERYPGAVLLSCLEKVIELIEKGLSGANNDEYLVEFEAYWSRQTQTKITYASINTENTQVRELDLWRIPVKSSFALIATETHADATTIVKALFGVSLKEAEKYRCMYLPLKSGTNKTPPKYFSNWDLADMKASLLSNLDPLNKKRFHQIAALKRKSPNTYDYVIGGLPIPNNNWALFGMEIYNPRASLYTNRKNRKIASIILHPFVQAPPEYKTTPLVIKRWNQDYLLNRTGGQSSLKAKHVVVVGVGAIGSEIANGLSKSGVGKLTLIDDDTYTLDNIYRHYLGGKFVFYESEQLGLRNPEKVAAMQVDQTSKYPFTKVEIYAEKFRSVFDQGSIDWKTVDLVICAIGKPNDEMHINQLLHGLPNPPATIYTWVEPLGIGGHALVTLNDNKRGCYQCLFKPDSTDQISNRASFSQPFQDFSRSITGCGSFFTPYSFLDASKTANLALEAGIKVLLGIEKGSPLLSWKGDSSAFEQLGYQLSSRYSFSVEKLHELRYHYIDDDCPICRERGE